MHGHSIQQMRDHYDIIIVGGGVIGLTIARALALRGVRDVCLVERGRLGTEASWAAAGMLLPQVEADAPDEFFNLACQSRDLYPAFAAALREETGIDVELDTTGTLYLALTEHDHEEIEKRYEWQTRAGFSVERLSAAEARELEPCISESTLGALRFPKDMQVENRRLLSALANSVKKLGVTTLTQTAVAAVLVEGNRVSGVQTSRGAISSATVVIAAGTWSSFIKLNSPIPTIEPVR